MGLHRTALQKFMNSFNLKADLLPEKKVIRDYGIVFCNVINIYKGDAFYKELRTCNIREKDGNFKPLETNVESLNDNLRNTIFVYLGLEDVASEFLEISKEYTEKLISQGHHEIQE